MVDALALLVSGVLAIAAFAVVYPLLRWTGLDPVQSCIGLVVLSAVAVGVLVVAQTPDAE